MVDDGRRNKSSRSVLAPAWVLLASFFFFPPVDFETKFMEWMLNVALQWSLQNTRPYKCINKCVLLLYYLALGSRVDSLIRWFSWASFLIVVTDILPLQPSLKQQDRSSPVDVGSCTSAACRLSTGSKSVSGSFVVANNCWITSLNYFQSISLSWKAHRKLIMFQIREIRILTC